MKKSSNNLNRLSDQELKDIYNGVASMKTAALQELNNRGIFIEGGKFTKRIVKTGKHIELFLRNCGFQYCASLGKRGCPYPSGCCEFLADIKDNKQFDSNLYCFQINGQGLSEIQSINEPVLFSINGKDPSITPLFAYSKEYQNFKAMIEGESDKFDFSPAFKNWRFN